MAPVVLMLEASRRGALGQWNSKGVAMKIISVMLAISLAGALAAGTAMAQTNSPSQEKAQSKMSKPADKASQKFIKAVIEGDIAEIDVGKLAQEKGQSEA